MGNISLIEKNLLQYEHQQIEINTLSQIIVNNYSRKFIKYIINLQYLLKI